MKYKIIENGTIVAIITTKTKSYQDGIVEITDVEYENIMEIIRNKPQDEENVVYLLDAESLEYIPFDKEIEVAE